MEAGRPEKGESKLRAQASGGAQGSGSLRTENGGLREHKT